MPFLKKWVNFNVLKLKIITHNFFLKDGQRFAWKLIVVSVVFFVKSPAIKAKCATVTSSNSTTVHFKAFNKSSKSKCPYAEKVRNKYKQYKLL
jgi:hypothetical protein